VEENRVKSTREHGFFTEDRKGNEEGFLTTTNGRESRIGSGEADEEDSLTRRRQGAKAQQGPKTGSNVKKNPFPNFPNPAIIPPREPIEGIGNWALAQRAPVRYGSLSSKQ
jgi:hypothetical protein